MRRVAPLEHLVHPEGHVTSIDDRGMNLDGPKTNNMLRNFKTISLIKCRPVQNLSSKSKITLGVKFSLPLKYIYNNKKKIDKIK
jgi:hypothetical protein